jgi:hypothetical protein
VLLLGLVLTAVLRRRPAPVAAPAAASEPPAWSRDFLGLAAEVLAVTELMQDALEKQRAALPPASPPATAAAPGPVAPSPAPVIEPGRERHREALALLRAGLAPEEVARRGGLSAAEIRLMRTILAAEAAAVRGV